MRDQPARGAYTASCKVTHVLLACAVQVKIIQHVLLR